MYFAHCQYIAEKNKGERSIEDSLDGQSLTAMGGWLPVKRDPFVGSGLPLDGVSPTPTPIDNVVLFEHVKPEGQKIDDVKVPHHLWSFF